MTAPEDKLRTIEALVEEVGGWRSKGQTTVLVNGAFDMLHVGHLRYLAGAKEHADHLIAAVNSDASIRSSKGDTRPIIPEGERVEILSNLWMVDRICLFDDATVGPVLELLKPDIHAKGTDYTADNVPERHVVAAYGGRTVICGDPKDHATTDLIGIIIERFGRQ